MEDLAYYPFGATRLDSNTPLDSHKYTGQEKDAETGLYNYNARLYDADLGRFITPDTIVQNPADPQTLNRYSYVGNNPINRTDPSGHSWLSKLMHNNIVGPIMGVVADMILPGASIYVNSQSTSGRYILSAEILAGTAALGVAPAGSWWAFSGAVSGGALGGYSASRAGGDLSSGILFGAAMGAATGYLGGQASDVIGTYTNTAFNNIFITKIASGIGSVAITGAGAGTTAGYAGGAGNSSSMLNGMWKGAAYGAVIGGALGFGEAWLATRTPMDYSSYFSKKTAAEVIKSCGESNGDIGGAVTGAAKDFGRRALTDLGRYLVTNHATVIEPIVFGGIGSIAATRDEEINSVIENNRKGSTSGQF